MKATGARRLCTNGFWVYLGMGSSLGDREASLLQALTRLDGRNELSLMHVSPIYESPHMGLEPGDETKFPSHLNLVAMFETTLSPEELLETVHEVEAEGKRDRTLKWGPRTIDIDILDYEGVERRTERLALPHPCLALRLFVVLPLLDLDPNYRMRNGEKLAILLDKPPLNSQKACKLSNDSELIANSKL